MEGPTYKMKGKVWLYPGMVGWHFISVDKKESAVIMELFGNKKRGFGSVPVKVTVGETNWRTSIFPDRKSGTYLLPIKASVREKENIEAEKTISYSIKILI